MRKVPLGLAYLASSLKQNGIRVEAYNLNVDDILKIDFKTFDFVGITTLTPFVRIIREMSIYIKEKNSSIKIILGGPHATYQTEQVFKQIPLVDYVISGEGEISLPSLVLNEADRGTIPGVHYLDESGVMHGTSHIRPDIHNLPWPEQRLFDHGSLEKRNPFRAIMASRGCPFKCYNCQPILNTIQPYRIRRVEDVVEEMRYVQTAYGQKYFGFVDSEFPIKKSWFHKLFKLIESYGMQFQFHCNAQSSLLNYDILQMYKKMNINRLAIGVESGVQSIIDNVLHKGIDLEYTHEMFELASGLEIRTHAHFMIGIPGETLDNMNATLDYALKLNATSLEFNRLTPWPGTKFWDICTENNYLTETDCTLFNEKRISPISTEQFTNTQVMEFFKFLTEKLIANGWRVTADGTVFYHKNYGGQIV